MNRIVWASATLDERDAALQRPRPAARQGQAERVAHIIERVRIEGDAALLALTAELDGCRLSDLHASTEELDRAAAQVPAALQRAVHEAASRIEAFHRAGMIPPVRLATAPGVVCERMQRAIGAVGLYVPAGTAPLPSSVLMLAIPAQLAGCDEVVLCTPPRADGTVDPTTAFAALACGVTRIVKLGGAQAIAAMALGSASVPRCDKIFGPGNAWVTEAKRQVAALRGGPAIDMPAGPSELLVIADDSADPEFVAADLLSQAEHGPDSQVLLLSPSAALLDAVATEVARQVASLPRAATAKQALAQSRLIQTADLATAMAISNRYAPEHLILNVREPRTWLARVRSAGSVFLGPWSPESVGDYASGSNHVLPTDGHARAYSGVSVASFQTSITVQELSREGLFGIAECTRALARAEGLAAHERAVAVRTARLTQEASDDVVA